jgi:hypothetical protein
MPEESRQAGVVQMFSGSAKFYDALYCSKDYAAASDRVHGLASILKSCATTISRRGWT